MGGLFSYFSFRKKRTRSPRNGIHQSAVWEVGNSADAAGILLLRHCGIGCSNSMTVSVMEHFSLHVATKSKPTLPKITQGSEHKSSPALVQPIKIGIKEFLDPPFPISERWRGASTILLPLLLPIPSLDLGRLVRRNGQSRRRRLTGIFYCSSGGSSNEMVKGAP